MLQFPHIDVEETFNQLVRDYGTARVLTDVLPKNSPPTNADYVFHSERIIAELKCLADDNSDSIKRQEKLNALLDTNFNEGKIKTKNS